MTVDITISTTLDAMVMKISFISLPAPTVNCVEKKGTDLVVNLIDYLVKGF